jgi:hypothetical protein
MEPYGLVLTGVVLTTVALVDGWLIPYLQDRWRRRARKHDVRPF